MNKKEIIKRVSQNTGIGVYFAEEVVSELVAEITRALIQGEKVSFSGFGTFEPVVRASRKARNPKTNEEITLPERTMPVFTPSKSLINAVAGELSK